MGAPPAAERREVKGDGEEWPSWTGICLASGRPAFWARSISVKRTIARTPVPRAGLGPDPWRRSSLISHAWARRSHATRLPGRSRNGVRIQCDMGVFRRLAYRNLSMTLRHRGRRN